jgi:hypothetical protein
VTFDEIDDWKARAVAAEARVTDLENNLAHWRQAAIDLAGHLELVRATLDAVIHETTNEAEPSVDA